MPSTVCVATEHGKVSPCLKIASVSPRVTRSLLALALLLFAACGGGGSASQPASSPAPASAPTITGLSVTPEQLDIQAGQTASLRATVTYSDASTADVTDVVSWRSSSPAQLDVDTHGKITAVESGTALVTATHPGGLSDSTNVAIAALPVPPIPDAGLVPVDGEAWTETSVRKVLHAFAFGGLATDAQIRTWADMSPDAAIVEMLTFTYNNEKLSPAQDATSQHSSSLESLQNFWSGSSPDNPMRWDKRRLYATLVTSANGTTYFISPENMQRAWVQAVSTRGVNPFLHRVAFFLSNYQLSVRASLGGNGLTRAYYDQILLDLNANRPMTAIIANAAKSAAVAARYDHRNNTFRNDTQTFYGNDDFAREYFQLFFRLIGATEDSGYHEGVSIENNARVLTGMQVDRVPNAYGSIHHGDWSVAPIRFHDHVDAEGRSVPNLTRHYTGCLEILRQSICGATAAEKLDALSHQVAAHPEVMANLPVYVVSHFADDQLTETKMAEVRTGWVAVHDDLLKFLRAYAISTAFHREDTVKFESTFTRNLALSSAMVLSNQEALNGHAEADFPRRVMRDQAGEVFEPVHDVFGGQTGVEASISAGIFKSAFDSAVDTSKGLALLTTEYPMDAAGSQRAVWEKDWRTALPVTQGGRYTVQDSANWLWQRLLSDGGKNFDPVARAQVYAFLATGRDFGQVVMETDPAISSDPEAVYSTTQLTGNARLVTLLEDLASREIELGSADASIRQEANRRMNLAAGFISMMPYSFALEGR